jgi:DNA-binding Lrp family transcriptional regulator
VTNRAYILVETSVGKTRDVAAVLRSVQGIRSVDVVTGPYDIIATIDSPDVNSMGALITDTIHSVGGVVRTVTCVSLGNP